MADMPSTELTEEDLANIQHMMEVDNLVEMAGDFEGGSIVVPGENISNLDIPKGGITQTSGDSHEP